MGRCDAALENQNKKDRKRLSLLMRENEKLHAPSCILAEQFHVYELSSPKGLENLI